MVLGEPQGVVAERIHTLGQRFGFLKHGVQVFGWVASIIGGSRILTYVAKVDMTGIQRREFGDHKTSWYGGRRLASIRSMLAACVICERSVAQKCSVILLRTLFWQISCLLCAARESMASKVPRITRNVWFRRRVGPHVSHVLAK
jgi:hypothetical protein